METAGVGLAIVGTCELCLKYEVPAAVVVGRRLRDTQVREKAM